MVNKSKILKFVNKISKTSNISKSNKDINILITRKVSKSKNKRFLLNNYLFLKT